MFPYPHFCSETCAALYERLAAGTSDAEHAAILFILNARARRTSAA